MPTFESLHNAYRPRVTAYFLRSGFWPADADDLVQETFLRAMKSLATFDPSRGHEGAWIASIARNVARRHWSRRQSDSFDPELADQTLAIDKDGPLADSESREEAAAVRQCVQNLPEELGAVVRLRYVEAMTTRGIAKRLGMPEATVRLKLSQARDMIETCLRAKGFVD